MRAIRATTTALLGVAALAPTAPTAAAAVHGGSTPFGFTVTPSTVAPGGRVTLGVTNCASSATVSSAVFDTVTVPSGRTAAATVDWDAKRGSVYQVSFTCNGTTGRTNLTIARAASTPTSAPTRAPTRTPTRTPARTPTRAPTVATTSVAPAGVRGGLGGSVGGVGSGELATGTALVVAATAGSAWTIRRRTEGRAH
ncbi:hypothetical protein ACFXKG_02105 [Streptomyces sp. NPDC059255]|uniref:hypothetical protein n=1 Tax=Streptomyces sp. NPDC059255 TaxID=3346793 RepID=UPI00369E4650